MSFSDLLNKSPELVSHLLLCVKQILDGVGVRRIWYLRKDYKKLSFENNSKSRERLLVLTVITGWVLTVLKNGKRKK